MLHGGNVYLTSPTITELKVLDLPILMDMLVRETDVYARLLDEEGYSDKQRIQKEMLENIQAAIEFKKKSPQSPTGSVPS